MMNVRRSVSTVIATVAAGLVLGACETKAADGFAACGAADMPAAAQTGGALSIAPLQFTCKKLENGLRVYAMPDKNTASVFGHAIEAFGRKIGGGFEHQVFEQVGEA